MISLAARTAEVDAVVRAKWPDMGNVALAAVGGYGRCELFPHSDIDLLIVSERLLWEDDQLRDAIAPFLRDLWDAGLRVSQSVHTLAECLAVSAQNEELSVSLLDRRYIAGDRSLFDQLEDPPRERLAPALANLARARHNNFGNTIFHLEPHVKDAPGALRDVHVIRWLGQLRVFAASPPAFEWLYRIRVALHEAAGRDQNLLTFAMQDVCAAALGLTSAAELMRIYYREAGPIYAACLEALGRVEGKDPVSAAGGEFPVRDYAALISWPELREILEAPHAGAALRAMHASGYLARLFPALRNIEWLVIRDFYHRYTVDEHSVVAVETAIDLKTRANHFGELARETPDYPLLLIALLLHDTGKGTESEDHARVSATFAREACQALGMSDSEISTVVFLIERHLDMSRLMTTRDPRAATTAATLGAIVGTIERLKLLTVLTYCDISSVNPTALTPWRATLLWQTYAATERKLTLDLHEHATDEGLPLRYQLTHSIEEIEEHHRMELEGRRVRLDRLGDQHRLTIVTEDRSFLIADVTGALAGFGMNILRAEAFVNDRHFAIDTFVFSDPMRTLDLNPSEVERFCRVVDDVIAQRRDSAQLLRGRQSTHHGRRISACVSVDNSASKHATLFEITAEDRPGILYELSRCLSESGCNIETVLVDTEGRKAIDVFYVTRKGDSLAELEATQIREALALIVA